MSYPGNIISIKDISIMDIHGEIDMINNNAQTGK